MWFCLAEAVARCKKNIKIRCRKFTAKFIKISDFFDKKLLFAWKSSNEDALPLVKPENVSL